MIKQIGIFVLCLFSLFASSLSAQNAAVRELEAKRKAALAAIEETSRLLTSAKQDAKSSLNRLQLLSAKIRSRQEAIDLLNQEIALELLGMEGAEVTAVENGRKAVEAFAQHPPQTYEAILMDIQMPKKSGYDVLKEIKKNIKVLVVSACAMEKDIALAKNIGCLDYMTKPVKIFVLLEKVKNILQ